jgi:hypothetical protein
MEPEGSLMFRTVVNIPFLEPEVSICIIPHHELQIHFRRFHRKANVSFGMLEDPGVDGMMIIKLIFRKWDRGPRSRLILLRIGTDGELL